MKYKAISLDPPWPFEVWSKATGNGRSAESHYRTMTWDDLFGMGEIIDSVADDDCAIFLWACRPSQHQALDMVLMGWNEGLPRKRQWAYKTEVFTWVKTTKSGKPFTGLGYWSRANTEPVLLFTRGKVKRLAKNVPQVIMAPPMRHSQKPEEMQNRVERLVCGPYLEIFARRRRAGWVTVGNELDGLDIYDSLPMVATDQPLPILEAPKHEPTPVPQGQLSIFDIAA